VFAVAISPRWDLQMPGAPYWLAAALMVGSFTIAWSVTRRAVAQVQAAE
jgi:hypothetical protein